MAGRRDSESAQSGIAPLLAGYRPLPGIFDEMMDRDGRVRSHWQPLLAMFAALGPKQLSARFAAADRHEHDSGVFYRVYEETAGAARRVRAGAPGSAPPSSPAIRSSCGRSLALRRRVACICDSMPLTSGGRQTGLGGGSAGAPRGPRGAGMGSE